MTDAVGADSLNDAKRSFRSVEIGVPTCTARALAMMNSSASSTVAMPPMPIMGIFTAR